MSDTITIDLNPSDRKLSLDLTDEQLEELERAVRTHPKAHMRQKAGALVKVSKGWSASAVAKYGLARRWRKNTVREWVHKFKEGGLEALEIGEGRGRKPAFSP
jgi:hypothetical protein